MPIQLSGSLVITGSITTTGVITMSGSIASASYSSTSDLLQGTGSVGFATTASLLEVSSSQQQISASYIALSASYNTFSGSASTRITENSSSIQQISSSQQQISASLLNVISIFATTGSNSFRATQSITGSLTVTGQIIAQTLNVQQVTSSIIYSSGSNNFGCDLNSRQTFTGSVLITGSLTIAGGSSATSYSGTTIYGSTAVCSPVGKFTTCLDLGGALTGTSATFANRVCTAGLTVTDDIYFGIGAGAYEQMTLCYSGYNSASPITTLMPKTAPGSGAITTMLLLKSNGLGGGAGCNHMGLNVQSNTYLATCDGKVGIGTGNPSALLDTTKNESTGNFLNSTADVVARFGNCNINPGNHYSTGIQVFQGCGTLGSGYAAGFLVADNNTATAQQSNTVSLISPSSMSGGVSLIAADASAPIRMFTGGFTCERMRITSAGTVCIGSSTVGGEILRVNGCSCSDNYISVYSGGIQMFLDADKTNNAGIVGTQSNHPLILRTNGSNKLSISTAGVLDFPGSNSTATSASDSMSFGVSGASYAWIQSWGGRALRINELGNNVNAFGTNGYGLVNTTASDVRIKKNIVSIENALDKVNCLRGVYYEFDENNSMCMKVPSGKRRVGLIAQEVGCVLPEALLDSQDCSVPISLDYSGMIGLLTKAIQEQQCTICSQASRITLLESCLGIA